MKRLFWLSVGVVAGASGTVWAERKIRTQLDSLQPDHLAVLAQKRAVSLGRQLVDAAVEGRAAMRDREVELRDQYRSPLLSSYHTEVFEEVPEAVAEVRLRR
ncbi:MAG: hypothetical protein WCJ04_04720 [Actinomycetes bacterium]